MSKEFKYIDTEISTFQADIDIDRVILTWDPIGRSTSFQALKVNGNEIGLATNIVSDDLTLTGTTSTFTIASSGMSTVDNAYANLSSFMLSNRNTVGRDKNIVAYDGTTFNFTTDKIEYGDTGELNGGLFGLASIKNLIDDTNIYIDSTITYGTSGDNKVVAYDKDTKILSVEGALSLLPSEEFTLTTAYYPILYTSTDEGLTYDTGVNLANTVTASASPDVFDGVPLYRKFSLNPSTLLNTQDSKFYLGRYLTFITGLNKGISRKIIDFDIYTREVTVEYFDYAIAADDIISINAYSFPLIDSIESYRFKIGFWNNDSNNPIYGSNVLAYPSKSLQNYLGALDNNYWDIDKTTDLYLVTQGVTQGGHAKAEAETVKQRSDFSISGSSSTKLYDNFGRYMPLEKNPNISFDRYRRRLLDVALGFRNGSTYEGLNNIIRAFTSLTPTTQFLSADGWRLGSKRLGHDSSITYTTVASGDTAAPYDTFTCPPSGLAASYLGDYVAITDAPSGTGFDISMIGKILPIKSYTLPATGDATFTIDPIGTPIPSGASITIFDVDYGASYGTIPYSSLAILFGTKIEIYGPNLPDIDKEALELLIAKVMPLHVKYFISYSNHFYGDASLKPWEGQRTALEQDYSVNILKPIRDEILEVGNKKDTINKVVSTVIDTSNTFTASGSTTKTDYYRNKNIKFTSGNNANISREVIVYTRGLSKFITNDFPYTIQAGDSFQVETVNYQTKYITDIIDLTDHDFFNASYFSSWFVRKINPSITEQVYIEFSADGVTFDTPIATHQNETLNTLINSTVTAVSSGSPTTTFTVSGSNISDVDDYYVRGKVKFLAGINAGEIRDVTSYNGTTKTFVTDAFGGSISTTDVFVLLFTDIKRYVRMTIYHNNIYSENDIEIESIAITEIE